jgi:hypothetical protein
MGFALFYYLFLIICLSRLFFFSIKMYYFIHSLVLEFSFFFIVLSCAFDSHRFIDLAALPLFRDT